MGFETIRSYLSTEGDHVGDVIWWTLADARIERSRLEAIWAAEGLSPDHLPEAPTPERALKAAIRECQVGQADRLIRLGKETESELIYAIVREQRHDDGSVSHAQETRVILARAFGGLTADDPGHELFRAIREAYRPLLLTHTPDDVRRAMLKVLGSCATVTLRDHGGVYWVPGPFAATARRLQAAVEQVGSSRVYLLPIHGSEDASRTLGEAARLSVEEELEALKTEIDGFLAEPPERASTLTRRLAAFDTLRARAHLYRDILRVEVDDLEGRLARLAGSVESMLVGKAAA